MLQQDYLGKYNFLVLTLDSCRFDTTINANTPNFKTLFNTCNEKWRKVYSHATFTLPSHCAMFRAGVFPEDRTLDDNNYSRRNFRMFICKTSFDKVAQAAMRETGHGINLGVTPNIVKGFESHGYDTIGIGGVKWFDHNQPTSAVWKNDFFKYWHWNIGFYELNKKAFDQQLDTLERQLSQLEDNKKFIFINVSTTHIPYIYGSQQKSLEYIDTLIPRLLDMLPRPLFVIICGDHGDCMGEDGLKGHGFYHLKVMEVPMVVLDLPENKEVNFDKRD